MDFVGLLLGLGGWFILAAFIGFICWSYRWIWIITTWTATQIDTLQLAAATILVGSNKELIKQFSTFHYAKGSADCSRMWCVLMGWVTEHFTGCFIITVARVSAHFWHTWRRFFWLNYAPSKRADNFHTGHWHIRCLVDSYRVSQRKYRYKSGLSLRSSRKSGSEIMSQSCCLRGCLKSCEHDRKA